MMPGFVGLHTLSKLNYLYLQGYGSKIFSMEGKVRVFHRKMFLWQGSVKTENLAEFPILMNSINENDKNEPPANSIHHYAALEGSARAISFIQ
jgi:hypothetical protein